MRKDISEKLRYLRQVPTDSMYDARLVYIASLLNTEINVRCYKSIMDAERDWENQFKTTLLVRLKEICPDSPFSKERIIDTARQVFLSRAIAVKDIFAGSGFIELAKLAECCDIGEEESFLLFKLAMDAARGVSEGKTLNGSSGELEPTNEMTFITNIDEIIYEALDSDILIREEKDVLERKRVGYARYLQDINLTVNALMYGGKFGEALNAELSAENSNVYDLIFHEAFEDVIKSETGRKAFCSALSCGDKISVQQRPAETKPLKEPEGPISMRRFGTVSA